MSIFPPHPRRNMSFIRRAIGLMLVTLALLLGDSQVVFCPVSSVAEDLEMPVVGIPVYLTSNHIPVQIKGKDYDHTLESQAMLETNLAQKPKGKSKSTSGKFLRNIRKGIRNILGNFKHPSGNVAEENAIPQDPVLIPLSKLEYSTAYWPFFREIREIRRNKRNKPLNSLAEMTEAIARERQSLTVWNGWVLGNQESIREFYRFAQDVLQTELRPEERLWVLGIVAALGNDLPLHCETLAKDLADYPWGEAVALEIKAAQKYQVPFTKKFLGSLNKKHVLSDYGLEECLERAKLISQHEIQLDPDYKIRELVAKHLTKIDLPQDDSDIKEIVTEIEALFGTFGSEIGPEERYTTAILVHLLKYPSKTQEKLRQLLGKEDTWKRISTPSARRYISNSLGLDEPRMIPSNILSELENEKGLSDESSKFLIQLLNEKTYQLSDSKPDSKRIKIHKSLLYKYIVAQSVFHPNLKKALINSLEDPDELPDYVWSTWHAIYRPFQKNDDLCYESLMFKNYLSIINDIDRKYFATFFKTHSEGDSRKMMLGQFLQDLKWNKTHIEQSDIENLYEEIKKIIAKWMVENGNWSSYHKIDAFSYLKCLMEYGEGARNLILSYMTNDPRFQNIFGEGAQNTLQEATSFDSLSLKNFICAIAEMSDMSSKFPEEPDRLRFASEKLTPTLQKLM